MEILNSLIRENNISFLRISIVDILGEKRSIEFPASALKDIYNNLVKCDGSSLCGIGTADNSDRVICLDENSHYFISDNTLEIFGFLQEENEETTVFDPREILNKQIKILNSKGYFLNVGIEPEFYIVDEETLDPIDDGTYFSNGDKVAYTWNVSDDLQGALNYKLKYKDGTIKVSGLEDAKKVDVFDDVSVDFEGQEPEGTATMTYQGNELDDSYFQYEPSEGLSNGDKVTVTLSEEGVASLTRDYGEVPEETEKEYTVSGLVCPLKSLNQIDDDSMKTLKKQAEDVYASYMGQNWDETSTLESLTYLGDYLLTDKNDSDGNILYLVYKAEIRSQYSDEEDGDTDTTDDIYWYISYSNVMLSDEGLQLDLVDYRTPGETTEVEGKGYNWSYYGYDSLDSLYKDVVTSNMDVYNHEDNVEDK